MKVCFEDCMLVASTLFLISLWSLASRCYSIFYYPFMTEFQMQYGAVSWINGFFQAGYGFGNLLFPILYKYISLHTGVMGSGLIASMSLLASSFATSFWQIQICAGLIVGVCVAGFIIGASTSIAIHFKKHRVLALQLSYYGLSLGGLGYCPAIQWLVDTYSWRGAMKIVSGIYLNAMFFGALLKTNYNPLVSKRQRKVESNDLTNDVEAETNMIKSSSVEQRRNLCNSIRQICIKWDLTLFLQFDLYLYVISWVTLALSYYSTIIFVVPQGRELGFTEIEAATLVSGVSFGAFGSRILYGLGFERLVNSYKYLTLAAAMLVSSSFYFAYAFVLSYHGLLSLSVVIGILLGGVDAVYCNLIVELFGVEKYASGYGYGNILSQLVGMCGTVALGYAIDMYGSETIVFIIGGVSLVTSSGLMILVSRRVKQNIKKVEKKDNDCVLNTITKSML